MIAASTAKILAQALTVARMRATIELAGADDGVERPAPGLAPTAFRIWRAGDNPTSKGATKFTRRSADLLLSEQSVRVNLCSIDVDHLSLDSTAPPEHHRAVGWHRLAVRETSAGPELWAVEVEWSAEIRAALESTPPGFRYFSPAYDVERETGEVVGYLNTALTNNPATFAVTALATRAAEERHESMKWEDVIASLTAAAEGDDPEKAKKAKAALAALASEGEPDGDEPKKDSEGEDDEPKKDSEGEEPKEEPKEEEPKKDSVAASLDAKAIEKLVDLKLKKIADDAERDRLLASRKDVGEKVIGALKSKPLALVREMLDAIPVSAKRNPAADATITATRGASESVRATRLPADEAEKLDERMGLARRRATVRVDGAAQVFEVMTTEDAARFLATKKGDDR
jgi:hypothetical protein